MFYSFLHVLEATSAQNRHFIRNHWFVYDFYITFAFLLPHTIIVEILKNFTLPLFLNQTRQEHNITHNDTHVNNKTYNDTHKNRVSNKNTKTYVHLRSQSYLKLHTLINTLTHNDLDTASFTIKIELEYKQSFHLCLRFLDTNVSFSHYFIKIMFTYNQNTKIFSAN